MADKTNDENRIAGCSFSVYPMCDQFADLILDALKDVDTSKVWLHTDEVSTIVRGRIPHVFDVSSAVFMQAASSGEHVVFSGTFSLGCPGDTEGHIYMAEDDIRTNAEALNKIEQDVAAKFALYPMGGGNYMEVIYEQIEAMKEHGVEVAPTHYETKLAGPAQNILRGLEKAFRETDKAGSDHTVMTVTVSANSPSLQH